MARVVAQQRWTGKESPEGIGGTPSPATEDLTTAKTAPEQG
jgi:hypothetical protein